MIDVDNDYSGKMVQYNTRERHESLGLTHLIRSCVEYVKNSKVARTAERIGRSMENRVKFVYSSFVEAAKETAKGYGIPTKRSYWKDHPGTAALTLVLSAAGIAVGTSDLYVLTDPGSSSRILNGKVPEDVRFFPPHRHNDSPINGTDNIQLFNRFLDLRDYLTLAAPLILVSIAVAINVYRFRKWKKSTVA